MGIYSRIKTNHVFLHTDCKSLLMPYITKEHPWTTTGILLTVLSDKYADQAKIKDIFDNPEIKDISGHKKIHAINFQSIAVPNALISNLYELLERKQHDSAMLTESWLLDQMQLHCNNANGNPLKYGDAAYPLHEYLQIFQGARLNDQQKKNQNCNELS